MQIPRLTLALAVALMAAGVGPSGAAVPVARSGGAAAHPTRVARPAAINTIDIARRIDVNNINMFVTNTGSFAWDLSTQNAGFIYPKGTTNTAVYASGLWLGAKINGQINTTVAEYSEEYGPGPMVSPGVWANASDPAFKVYKVIPWTGNASDTAHVTRTPADPTQDPLVHHSWSEYMAGAVPYGAPWKIWRLPTGAGDSTDVPGPDVSGDQMLWAVYNDGDPNNHTNEAGGTNPMDVEVQQTTFAFNRQGALGNTIFLKFKIINKGSDTLDQMFVSLWADPDLGGATDDLVGVDTSSSLGYVYNATNHDQLYGARPPAVGYDFFLGPVDKHGTGDTLAMTSFNKYINGTDPAAASQTYNYMQGLEPDGSPVIDPTTGLQTHFFHPGDPVTGVGWLDSNPSDRRMMLSSGPFTMVPGDTQIVVGAIIVGQGNDRLSSISGLRFYDTFAQDAFNRNFVLPSPPPAPVVDVTTDADTVRLCWDRAALTNYTQAGYSFEGYNVYQGATISGPWTRVATYDIPDQVRVIFDEVFDVTTGQLIPLFPVAFGSDVGLQFCTTLTQDAIRGGSLKIGTPYYFAVTAYAYGPDQKPTVLETAQQPITVIPQRPALGTNFATAGPNTFTYTRIDTTKNPSTDVVDVRVVTPNVTANQCYKVTFSPLPSPTQVVVGADTITVTVGYNLINTTTGDTLLKNQINISGDENYPVVQGIQVKVTGKYVPQLQSATYVNAPPNPRPIDPINAGLEGFGGGAGYGASFLGSTLDPASMPDSFTTVELRFNGTQKGYRYFRKETTTGAAPTGGRGYTYAGFYDVPFQAWDTVHNRQIDVGWVERAVYSDDGTTLLPPAQQPAVFDSTWLPGLDSGGGDREYLLIFDTPYSNTPKAMYQVDGAVTAGTFPVEYAMWVFRNDPAAVFDPGDKFVFQFAVPATPNDVYSFCTSQLQHGNVALEKQGLNRIRVVPNPYYAHSRYELSQFNRVIRFINMPETATVRIFNLAGVLVRTLHKTDPTSSVLDWDLQTENRLPVGSGIYIYHVDVPGAGSTFGRMVVFMEKERLNNF